MEVMLKRSPAVKEKKRADDSPPGDEVGDNGKKQLEIGASRDDGKRSKSSSPVQKDSSIRKQDNQLETTRAEMGEVKQENERLKTILSRILKDYQSLQMHFFDILEREKEPKEIREVHREMAPESDLVSLSLGRSASSSGGLPKKEETMKAPPSAGAAKDGGQYRSEGLSLSLDCEYGRSSTGSYGEQDKLNSSRENSLELAEAKEEEAGEPWPPSKILKNMRRGNDEISQQQAHVKKARVSVRARCDAPTMNDGCQWRKYGQKIAKGNPCPRAYYRCTVAPACPVRKQVQRCAEDMSILITTYEGTHNHPLPVSATAMASTTAAAASMLTSGPSASPQMIRAPPMAASSASIAGLHGLSFCLPDVSRQRQLYLPNPSMSTSPSFPATITLDLTSPPSSSAAAAAAAQFHRFSPNLFSSGSRYAPTTFNFSTAEPSPGTASWGGVSYGAPAYPNKSGQLLFNQSYLQRSTALNSVPAAPPNQQSLTPDTIAAATKAITADPTFQSALAAAITSIVGGQGIQGATETSNTTIGQINHIINWGERLASPVSPAAGGAASANGTGACPSSYLTRSTTPSANPAPSTFSQPSLMTISSTKSSSASPIRTRE